MKRILAFSFLVITATNLLAQNFDFSCGGLLGINGSFISSKAFISSEYLASDPSYIRNLSISKKATIASGYTAGFFIKIQPIRSKLSLKSGIYIVKYNNSTTIAVSMDRYQGHWSPWTESIFLDNHLTLIQVPLIAGYDLIKKEVYGLTLFGGVSANLNVNEKDNYYLGSRIYKTIFPGYQIGFSINIDKIFISTSYDYGQNIHTGKSIDQFPSSMDVQKLYLNSFSITLGINLNNRNTK